MSASRQKSILVYGFGATGMSVARYMQRRGLNAMYYDSRAEPPGLDSLHALIGTEDIRFGDAGGILDGVKYVVVSPGIADNDALLTEARARGIRIMSDIEIFVEHAQAPIVAVTGSNGKSTVTTLLALMSEASGKRALAGANLGRPALDLLEEQAPDYYVLELSSFQLHRVPRLPAAVAGLLNISPDHLDWHTDEAEYRNAKYRIFRDASAVVFNRADPEAQKHFSNSIPVLSFGMDEPSHGQYGIRREGADEFIAHGEQLLLNTGDLSMVGRHNQQNAMAALAIGQLMGLDVAAMLQVLNEFPGLPHRMQFVDRINGTTYINDSKATNVGAAVASIDAIDGHIILIAGGQGKGGDFKALANAVHRRLRCAVLIGDDADEIAVAFKGLAPTERAGEMHGAVRIAANIAEADDTVLLAPACASFDMYPNYMKRGEDFCKPAGELRA